MQHINGAYTTYFNVKRKRSGHLFQGRYRSILIEADTYAKELSRYIHLNPVRAGMADTPEEYEWSSYLFYAVEEDKPDWLFTDLILGYFSDTYSVARQKYRSFVRSLIGKQYRSPLTGISLSAILGLPDFVDEIKGRFLSKEKHDGNLPLLKEPGDRPSMEEIAILVGSTVKEDDRVARQMQIYLCHRYTGARLLEIGNRYGIGESAVSQNSRRFSERLSRDRELRKATKLVKKELGIPSV